PIPFLKRIVSEGLQELGSGKGFAEPFKDGLDAVYRAQFEPGAEQREDGGYVRRFLADTTKVGWQADRHLWQGGAFETRHDAATDAEVEEVQASEVGVVPIFGGISWTEHPITQVWYPSEAYHDQKGVLTGAYNFGNDAHQAGRMPVAERLDDAREGAALFNEPFAEGLGKGVAIAWQNMPYIKGGWAQWNTLGDDATDHFNELTQGTEIISADGARTAPVFFIIGDQLSSLPGWQEGAIASSVNALNRMTRPDLEVPYLERLPDTRLMVEGI
ncbi:MAG: amine oxidase, partial [Acidobacteriota bacterium]